MSENPWFRFFPSDWLAGTRGMSAVETGIYITLIAHMYDRGAPLAEDIDRLARLCGATKQAMRSALEALISDGKIIRVDGGIWNNRVRNECKIREEKSQSAKQNANTRWNQNSKKDQQNQCDVYANASETHAETQCETDANQNPDIKERIPNGIPKKRKVDDARRGTRLSPDWKLPDEWAAWARDAGCDDPHATAERFCDYWVARAGAGGVKLDWLATWRNWVRSNVERRGQRSSGGGSSTTSADAGIRGAELALARRRAMDEQQEHAGFLEHFGSIDKRKLEIQDDDREGGG